MATKQKVILKGVECFNKLKIINIEEINTKEKIKDFLFDRKDEVKDWNLVDWNFLANEISFKTLNEESVPYEISKSYDCLDIKDMQDDQIAYIDIIMGEKTIELELNGNPPILLNTMFFGDYELVLDYYIDNEENLLVEGDYTSSPSIFYKGFLTKENKMYLINKNEISDECEMYYNDSKLDEKLTKEQFELIDKCVEEKIIDEMFKIIQSI